MSEERGSQHHFYFWNKVARFHLAKSEVRETVPACASICLHQIKAAIVCHMPVKPCWPWWGYFSPIKCSLAKACGQGVLCIYTPGVSTWLR